MLAENKRARFDYEIIEEIEAGVELSGFEVKAARTGKMRIAGAHAIIRGGEAYLVGAEIAPYQPGNEPKDYEPGRTIKLLLHRQEIAKLTGKIQERGLTIVPIKVYNKSRKIKILLGLAKSKKKHDKREKIKERDVKKQIERNLKKAY